MKNILRPISFVHAFLFSFSFLCLTPPLVMGDLILLSTNISYVHQIASFGPRLSDTGFVSSLISIDSFNPNNIRGCTKPTLPPEWQGKPWIALVQQGDCTYIDKVRNMQASGAIGIVVGSNNPLAGLLTMQSSGDVSDVIIPAVYITYDDYIEVLEEFHHISLNDSDIPFVPVRLNKSDQQYWPIINIIIARIIAPVIIMVFLYTVVFRFRRTYRTKETNRRQVHVQILPKRNYSSKDADQDHNVCSICLEEYVDGDELRILPCKHEFHVACVDPWLLLRKKFCPLCKKDAFVSEGTSLV